MKAKSNGLILSETPTKVIIKIKEVGKILNEEETAQLHYLIAKIKRDNVRYKGSETHG